MNPDRRGKIVKAMSSAVGHKPERIFDMPLPPGIAAYSVASVLLVMPALLPNAPQSVRRAYRDRIIANATGRCPKCDAVADSEDMSSMSHEHGCPVSSIPDRWLDPDGLAAIALGVIP